MYKYLDTCKHKHTHSKQTQTQMLHIIVHAHTSTNERHLCRHTQQHCECILITACSARDAPAQRASVQTLNTDHRQTGQCFILAREHYRLITPP